jgi:hypothetical protein
MRHVSMQVLNRFQREKIGAWGPAFKRRMSGLFTRLLVMCAYCGVCTWEPKQHGWELYSPEGEWFWGGSCCSWLCIVIAPPTVVDV